MSDNDEKQTAVSDTESEASPSPEVGSNAQGEERDPYAEALAEWESNPPQQPVYQQQGHNPAQSDQGIDPEEFRQLQRQIAEDKFRADMSNVVQGVRGELPADKFDDVFMEGWLEAMSRKDPRIITAWDNRAQAPEKFQRLVKGLNQQFKKQYGSLLGIDEKATEDRELVAHAVRGGSKPAPEERLPELGSLPDGEYRQYVKKKFGFDPGV